MEETIKKVNAICEIIVKEIERGSKASYRRARRATIEAEKIFKQFRKESVLAEKGLDVE